MRSIGQNHRLIRSKNFSDHLLSIHLLDPKESVQSRNPSLSVIQTKSIVKNLKIEMPF